MRTLPPIVAVFLFPLSSARAVQVVISTKVLVRCNIYDSDVGIDKGKMKFSNDGISWSAEKAYAQVEPDWDLSKYGGSTSDGLKTIYGRFSDSLGNWTENNIKIAVILDTTTPTTYAVSPGGMYSNTQSVTLVCDDGSGSGCSATYYTTDGTEPTVNSPKYSEAITVNSDTSIKFFSVDAGRNVEAIKAESYHIALNDSDSPLNTISEDKNEPVQTDDTEAPHSIKVNSPASQEPVSLEQTGQDVPTINEWGSILLFTLVLLQFAKISRLLNNAKF